MRNLRTSSAAACVWLPLYALRCEITRRPALADAPLALLSPDDPRRVWQISRAARHEGVRPGMTISQAIGLCATLLVLEPDPVYYDQQFAELLLQLTNVSPVIEPAELGRVFVGMDGLEGLYGEPEQQLEIINCGLRSTECGMRNPESGIKNHSALRTPHSAFRLGWARGKFISYVAASRAKPGTGIVVHDADRVRFLSTQPLALLPLDADAQRRLWRLGLKTLGDLAALPEDAVSAQFGKPGRDAWRLASGLVTDPVTGRETPEPIVEGLDFLTPIADTGMLANALDRLIERALRHPRRTGWRVQRIRVRAALEQGASWLTDVVLRDPSAERALIAAPLRVRLSQMPPTGAVTRLVVEFTAFVPGTAELQLFTRDAASAARAGRRRALRAAAREIESRFQHSMLYRPIEVQPWSRLPERRSALIAYDP